MIGQESSHKFGFSPREWLGAIVISSVVLSVYALTLAPTVTGEDSGELIAASYLTGVAHPPGYPLYCIMTKPFFLIPYGDMAWRANFASAFYGALTCGGVFMLIIRWGGGLAVSWMGSLALGFSYRFWGQSTIAEVYTLNTFMTVVVLHFIELVRFKPNNEPQDRVDTPPTQNLISLLLLGLIFGLSLSNHYQLMLMISPALLILIIPAYKFDWFNKKSWAFIVAALVLCGIGLLTYSYLYFAAKANPFMNWGDPSTLENLLRHVRRDAYNFLQFGNADKVTLYTKYLFIRQAAGELWIQFTPWLLLLVPFGLVKLWQRDRYRFIGSIAIVLLNFGVCIFALEFSFDKENQQRMEPYYLPAYLIVATWIGLGASWFLDIIKSKFTLTNKDKNNEPNHKTSEAVYLGVTLALCLPLIPLYANYADNDRSDFTIARTYSECILNSVEENAIVYPGADYTTFPLVYLVGVEKIKPEVFLPNKEGDAIDLETRKFVEKTAPELFPYLHSRPSKGDVVYALAAKSQRPFYLTTRSDFPPNRKFDLAPYGLLYKVLPAGSRLYFKEKFDWNMIDKDTLKKAAASPDSMERALASAYYRMHAEHLLYYHDFKNGRKRLLMAADIAKDDHKALNNLGSIAANYKQVDIAIKLYNQACEINSKYITPLTNLARISIEDGRFEDARGYISRIEKIDSRDSRLPAIKQHYNMQTRRLRQIKENTKKKEAIKTDQKTDNTPAEITDPNKDVNAHLKRFQEIETELKKYNRQNPAPVAPNIPRPPQPPTPSLPKTNHPSTTTP